MGIHHVAIAAATYVIGSRVRVESKPSLAARTANIVKSGGVVPTKMAQIIALRSDVFADEHLLRELRSLQSRRVDEDTFVATVRIHRDTNVAVKSIKCESVLRDAGALRMLAIALRVIVHFAPKHPSASLLLTVHMLLREVDLREELDKNRMITGAFPSDTVIKIPRTYESDALSARMEYVPSVLAKDLTSPVDIDLVNRFFADIVYAAVSAGVLHMDLHSGNVGHDGDRIVVYDMGSVHKISKALIWRTCCAAMEGVECVLFGDYERLSDSLHDQGLLTSLNDLDSLRKIMDVAFAYAAGEITASGIAKCMRQVGGDVGIDPALYQLIQSMSLLEGTCKVMNPAFTLKNAMNTVHFVRRMPPALENLASDATAYA
jgi:predicted unusual protein kinase regulating ubiquinone biosynthesis (AarF/ABC1/UbiB family)